MDEDFVDLDTLPGHRRASVPFVPRYEDVTQGGLLKLVALAPMLGEACWRGLLRHDPASQKLRRANVLPILRRFRAEATDARVHPEMVFEARGGARLARASSPRGTRVLLELFVEAWVTAPEGAGPRRVGRALGEHVFTRPFAAPGDRAVDALPFDEAGAEGPFVPELLRPWIDAAAIVPADAEGRAVRTVRFGPMHTDSNQHVNSLEYLRAFEEAALLASGGDLGCARAMHVVYERPCFAGDEVTVRSSVDRPHGRGVIEGADGRSRARIEATFAPDRPAKTG